MLNQPITATPDYSETLSNRISAKFWKTKAENNQSDVTWRVKDLEERVQYLEFALSEVMALLEENSLTKE